MARILVKVAAYMLCCILAFSLAGCRKERHYRIGVSQCSQDDWRNKMNDEINREVMLHPEATVEIRSADDSNEKQIADIRYFKDNGFDIIIAAPNEADAITPIIKEVYESGTPVIVFDRDINGDTYTAYQGVDNVALGKAAAHYARHLVGAGGNVLEIYGLSGSTPAIGRHDGFKEGAAEEDLRVLASAYGNWNYNDAARVADSLLRLYPQTQLVYAHNDRMAIAASETARRKGMDIKVIGIDAAPEIGIKAVADSVIDATFLYPTERHRLIRTALAILKGEPYEKDVLLPVSSAVDKTNADILLLQNASLVEETSKMKKLKSRFDIFWNRHSVQTVLFYACIVILVLLVGVLFLVLRAFWQHRRHRMKVEQQNAVLEQQKVQLEQQRDALEELNRQLNSATQSKLMFFTNVSHDLRTPLTLISEPVEQLAAAHNLTPGQSTLMRIAAKNVRILKRLINQILDFRKYENGKLDTHLAEVPFAEVVNEWGDAFRSMAAKRDIKLTSDVRLPAGFTIAIDTEKMERVFYNLMSNAFKYTPDNGRINFEAFLRDGDLVFTIADSGRGIAREDLDNIFDRFFQVDKVHPNGSGLGLSLAKAFVELHGGSISVESTPGKGSRFTVALPVRHVEKRTDESAAATEGSLSAASITAADVENELGGIESEIPAGEGDKPLLLVIDDNEDMRRMVGELMADSYTLIYAPDGKTGVRLAAKYVPDLIICDVMMPVMDGLECCRRIKGETSTSHIPVLMLTACSMDSQRVEGYESGADGYVSKPFNAEVLRVRCESLIKNRRRIKDLWQPGNALPQPKPAADTAKENRRPPVADVENEFYSRFLETVYAEMGNPDLNVDALASKMNLGRSQFYRKIKALTNYTPVELLRNLRLKHAREQLSTTDKPISKIAYEAGFSTPAYFTRCYRDYFGETPSDLRDRLGGK